MRSSREVRASDSQCQSRSCPGFDPSILRHSGIWGAADDTVLNKVLENSKKSPWKKRDSNTSLWCQPAAWSWIFVILVPNTSKSAGKVSVKYFLLFLKKIWPVFPFFSCHFWNKRPKFRLVNYRRPADKPRAQFTSPYKVWDISANIFTPNHIFMILGLSSAILCAN